MYVSELSRIDAVLAELLAVRADRPFVALVRDHSVLDAWAGWRSKPGLGPLPVVPYEDDAVRSSSASSSSARSGNPLRYSRATRAVCVELPSVKWRGCARLPLVPVAEVRAECGHADPRRRRGRTFLNTISPGRIVADRTFTPRFLGERDR